MKLAKNLSHYPESSLNDRTIMVSEAKFFINFDYKISTRILHVCIKYSMCDLILNVISYCFKMRYR